MSLVYSCVGSVIKLFQDTPHRLGLFKQAQGQIIPEVREKWQIKFQLKCAMQAYLNLEEAQTISKGGARKAKKTTKINEAHHKLQQPENYQDGIQIKS
jgi:predicted transposase YbfD/YdcC